MKYIFSPLVDAILECAGQQGILGTRVGGMIQSSGTTLFAAQSGSEKKGDSLQREVKEFLVLPIELMSRYLAWRWFDIFLKYPKNWIIAYTFATR